MPQIKCKTCGKEFYGKPSHIKRGWAKYCSKECQNKSQTKGKFVNCKECGKATWRTPRDFRTSKTGNFFCNKSCSIIWRNRFFSRSKHPNWKGGEYIDYKNILIQSNIDPVCKICKTKDKRVLIAHHKDRNRKNHNIKNLIWLCHNCHHLVHCYDTEIK